MWIEVAHRFASNFSTNKLGVEGGLCGVGGYKHLLFWRRWSGDRFDLINGNNGTQWWSAHPGGETQPMDQYGFGYATCSGIGWNCHLGYGGKGTSNDQAAYRGDVPADSHDGQWHLYRVHIKLPAVKGETTGVFEMWLDGKLVKRVTGQAFIRRDGGWSNRLEFIALGSNSNSGTAQASSNWWGHLKIWTTNPGW
jgi:hypothetical protein